MSSPSNVPPPAGNSPANSLVSGAAPSGVAQEYSAASRLSRTDQPMLTVPVNWAESVEDDWIELPVPHIDPDTVVLPLMDDSWGAFRDLLEQACRKWEINHQTGESAGSLRGHYFKPDVVIKDAGRIVDLQYVAGYMSALHSVWHPDLISGDKSTPMFKNGFADAIPLILRPAALRSGKMNPEQARVMLREPKRGDANPLKKRLASMMSVPTNATAVTKAVEILLNKISAKIDLSKLDRVLDIFSANRRIAIQRMYPLAQREKVVGVKGKKQLFEQVQIVVQPTVAQTYKSLATPVEQRVITDWNNFARSENIPTQNRRDWRTEYEVAQRISSSLTSCASSIRKMLKDRKQIAYSTLSDEARKTESSTQIALASAIRNVVSGMGTEDHISIYVHLATEGCSTLHDLVIKRLAHTQSLDSASSVKMAQESQEPTPTNAGDDSTE